MDHFILHLLRSVCTGMISLCKVMWYWSFLPLALTHWFLKDMDAILKMAFHSCSNGWYPQIFLWLCPQMNVTRPCWWWLYICFDDGLVLLVKKLLPDPRGVCFHKAWRRVRKIRQISRPLGRRIWRTVPTSPSALWKQTRQIHLIRNYNMASSISPLECLYVFSA